MTRNTMKHVLFGVSALALSSPALAQNAPSSDSTALMQRLDRLEAANARLQAEVNTLRATGEAQQVAAATTPAPTRHRAESSGSDQRNLIGFNPEYSTTVLEHTEGVNQRLIAQLDAVQDGLLDNIVTVSGRVVAIADAHWSNRANKFGYLMRHPTGNNQRTKATQEATISSAQLAVTFRPHPDFTGYVEMLYDPEQSFGAGTLTALTRNQVQVRKAYVLWGNLDKTPFYAAMGKMDVPFGLEDSVSPFTNSTNWHAFAPLAYGAQLGYYADGVSLRGMMVVGGSQFRGANTPVDGTAIPSKLNNFAIDASYTYELGEDSSVMVGGSYLHGTAYCQNYPVVHFNPCSVRVPAWAAYGRLRMGRFMALGEFARTTEVWPGTQVPDPLNPLSQFAASRVTSFTFGGRYNAPVTKNGLDLSVEYSKFIAGADGAPWERQDQMVFGVANRLGSSVSVFGEYIRTNGFAPLNFISGGNQPDGSSWSDASAKSNVLVLGVKAGF